jgi:hypothetical protein
LINKPRCWFSNSCHRQTERLDTNSWTARYSTPKTWRKYTWRNILIQSQSSNQTAFLGDTLDTSVSGISASSLKWIIVRRLCEINLGRQTRQRMVTENS